MPKKNRSYWEQKFASNQQHDRRITRKLRNSGWYVIRLWEHELKKSPTRAIRRIVNGMDRAQVQLEETNARKGKRRANQRVLR